MLQETLLPAFQGPGSALLPLTGLVFELIRGIKRRTVESQPGSRAAKPGRPPTLPHRCRMPDRDLIVLAPCTPSWIQGTTCCTSVRRKARHPAAMRAGARSRALTGAAC